MARYDIFETLAGSGYLLEVQADLLSDLKTRVVVPLLPLAPGLKVVKRLNPIFVIGGKQYALFVHLIATVPAARLGERRANALDRHDDIVAALDMLFQGF